MNVVDHECVGCDIAVIVIVSQMSVIGRKIIVAMGDHVRIA